MTVGTMPGRIWLNTKQAAEHAGRHPVTLRRALEAGELHGSQRNPGRSTWRIHVECLDAWVAGRSCEHQASNVRPLRSRTA